MSTLPSTYSALCVLSILGDPLDRVRRAPLAALLRACILRSRSGARASAGAVADPNSMVSRSSGARVSVESAADSGDAAQYDCDADVDADADYTDFSDSGSGSDSCSDGGGDSDNVRDNEGSSAQMNDTKTKSPRASKSTSEKTPAPVQVFSSPLHEEADVRFVYCVCAIAQLADAAAQRSIARDAALRAATAAQSP